MAFAQIYICSEHGEVDGCMHESIDVDRDKVEPYMVCEICNREVKPLLEDGKPVVRALTDDEILAESGFYDDYE